MNITIPKRKRALFLHYAGLDVDEIFDTLSYTGEDNDYATAVAKLNEYFSPQVNSTYEVYNFRQAEQKEGELLDSYHTRLRQLAKTCARIQRQWQRDQKSTLFWHALQALHDAERFVKTLR